MTSTSQPKTKPLALLIASALVLLCTFYSEVLLRPNSYVFSAEGDGISNYYSTIYHIKHDTTYAHFGGMNYPYGETVYVMDCQPILANTLHFVNNNIVDISEYSVGVLNYLMVLAILLCAIFVFLILHHYNFSGLICVLGGLGIAFLSSQVLLMQYGQYAMVYSCFFPISWFLLIKHFEHPRMFKYSIYIFLNTVLWSFINYYLGLIVIATLLIAHLFIRVGKKSPSYNSKQALIHVFIQLVFSAAVVFAIVSTNDTYTDRIEMPYLTRYKANLQTTFFSQHSFVKPAYDAIFGLTDKGAGRWGPVGNYVGLSTGLILLFVLIKLVIFAVRKQWDKTKELLPKHGTVYLISAILLLLYAMAIPFQWGLEWLIPDTLVQFTGLGRFAWAFYFVITIFSLHMLRALVSKKQAAILLSVASILMLAEGLSYHFEVHKKIIENENIFASDSELKTQFAEFDLTAADEQYQGIIALPFYQAYNAVHAFTSTEKAKNYSMALSYHTGLPLVNGILSRPSMSHCRNIVQLFAPAHYEKPIAEHLNAKPFLILWTKDAITNLEKAMLDKATVLANHKEYKLYSVPVNALLEYELEADVQQFITQQDAFYHHTENQLYTRDSCSIFYEDFDDREGRSYRGNGAYNGIKNEINIYFETEPYQLQKGQEYELSFWYFNHHMDQSFNTMNAQLKSPDGTILNSQTFRPTLSNIYDGDWALHRVRFTPENEDAIIQLFSRGSERFDQHITVDEILVRPVDQDVYMLLDPAEATGTTTIYRNNEVWTFKNAAQ